MGKEIKLHEKMVMKVGTWNGIKYTKESVRDMFKKLPKRLFIFEEFKEDLEHCIGIAENFKLEKDKILADITLEKYYHVWPYLGIMPKILMDMDRKLGVKNAKIESFGLTLYPAIK